MFESRRDRNRLLPPPLPFSRHVFAEKLEVGMIAPLPDFRESRVRSKRSTVLTRSRNLAGTFSDLDGMPQSMNLALETYSPEPLSEG
jgi:hypothetical protein